MLKEILIIKKILHLNVISLNKKFIKKTKIVILMLQLSRKFIFNNTFKILKIPKYEYFNFKKVLEKYHTFLY
jgi:hypothetical protein